MAQKLKRKLSAILSADVKGYSRLMGEDEEWTVRTLDTFKGVMNNIIPQHRGRVVDSTGDNLLAEFASIVDAVQAAVEIQQVLRAKNSLLPENRRMQLRIGINLGDVIEEGERIFGDGVNIAARLEGLAEAGGICVSGSAFEQIENKLPLHYDYLGEHEVKNITRPVRVYRALIDNGAVKEMGARSKADPQKMAFPLPDKPSIAVLPFENMSNDKEQEYFADGLTEEIINGLSKVEHVFVIARSSTFTYKNKPVKVQQVAEEMGVRYVLEGSVRKTGDTVRITAQLVDALNGRHIFSERYDRDFKDILTVQDEITMKILTALQVVLTKGEAFQLLEKGTKNLEAYLKVLKAMQLKAQFNKEAVAIARRYAEEAIALDPAYAGGYSTLAGVIINETYVGAAKTPHAEAMQEALVMAEKAVNLEPSSSNSHEMLSLVYAFSQNPEKALSEAEKAVALSPSSAYAYHCMGAALMVAERFHEAIPIFQKSLRLSPIPHTSGVLGMLGTSYRFIGQYEDAIATYKRMSTLYPDNLYSHAMLASTYATVGRDEEAHAEAAEVLKIDPHFSSERFVNAFLVKRNKKLLDETLNDLRKAGLK
jgi:adenylate cyclase